MFCKDDDFEFTEAHQDFIFVFIVKCISYFSFQLLVTNGKSKY